MNIIIEPHPDDAFLGCYSLLKLGLIDGIITVSEHKTLGELRKKEQAKFIKYFNIDMWYYFGFPDGELFKYIIEIYERINKIVSYQDVIFIPSTQESNPDHRTISGLNFPDYKVIEYFVWNRPRTFDVVMKTNFEKKELFEKLYPSQVGIPADIYRKYEYFRVRK